MIVDIFKLKKDSWHMRLMTWMWGYKHYDFPNMCPYFWLSVLNIFLCPFKYVIYILLTVFRAGANKLGEWLDAYDESCRRQEEEWRQQIKTKVIIDDPLRDQVAYETLAEFYRKWSYDGESSVPKKYRRLFDREWSLRERLSPLAGQMQEKIWAKQTEEETRLNELKAKRKSITLKVGYIKIAAKVIGVGIALALLVLITKGLIWVVVNTPWMMLLIGVGKVLICVVVACILGGIVYTIGKSVQWLFCRYGAYCIPCESRRLALGKFFLNVFKGIAFPFIWTWFGLVALWTVIKALKENNCPGIDWE